MRNISIFIFILLCVSCISIKNKNYLIPLSNTGDNENRLNKNGYYYIEKYVKTNPYYVNKNGGSSRDSTRTYSQVRVSPIRLTQNGSAMKLGTYSGMRDKMVNNYGVKCDLLDNNTLKSALDHFECYVIKWQNKNLKFKRKKAEICDQGLYKIINNKITIQIFYKTNRSYNLYEETGTILNDSTFIMTKIIDYETNKTYTINKKYKFKTMDNFPNIDNYILKNKLNKD